MKRMKLLAPLWPLLLLVMLTLPALAVNGYIVDNAGLLTEEQFTDLEEQTDAARKKTGMDLVIVTEKDIGAKTPMEYADDYYDYNGYSDDGALFLIDMGNRELWISTKGRMIDYLTDARIESVLDDVYAGMADGDYYAACTSFLEGVQKYYQQGIPDNHYRYDTETGEIIPYRSVTLFEFLIALAISAVAGIIACVIVIGRYRSGYAFYQYPYREKGRIRLTRVEDTFINSRTTSYHIQRSSGGGSSGGRSSGGSSTHTSSSGSTHGGGGRSF